MTEFEKNRIINGNIFELIEKKQSCDDRLYVHCRDKMSMLSDTALSDLPELFGLITDGFPECEKRLCADILYRQRMSDINSELFLGGKSGKKKSVTIAFLDNPASREALAELEKLFDECRGETYYDFSSVCEAVHDQHADMCILPIENSVDGRLTGFYNLISKYELFTVSVCDVMNYDTSVRTRFSLLSSEPMCYFVSDEICCVMQFELNRQNTLASVVSVAEHFGVYCAGVSSIPEPHVTQDFKGVFNFEGKRQDMSAFLFFLYLTSASFILQGIYDKI